MNDRSLRAALISTDPRFLDQVRDVLLGRDLGVSPELEFAVPFAEFAEEQVQALRQLGPDLVIVDLESDPDLGVKFVQFLHDSGICLRVVAAGPTLSPELLLAAMRAGVADYLPKPVPMDGLEAAVQRIAQQLGRSANRARRPGQVYAVFSAKGGSGSSTLAANLAIVLHRLTNKRTLLVDLDLELGEAALLLGIQPRFNFVDLVQNFHRMDAGLLASYIERHESGVHLLSAPYHPEKVEGVSGEEIRRILHFLRQHYDYIVVDTSKSFSPATLAAFDQSDLVFLVTTVDLPSLRNIQRGLPMLKRVLARGDDQIRLVVNRYHDDDPITPEDVHRTIGLKVFWKIANDYEAVMGSINSGKPIVLNGKSAYTQDVRALGAEVAGLGGAERNGRGAKGIMGRLFGRRSEEKKA